jgi:hypothetical protein
VRFVRGDPDTNLYLYIWKYDKAGFGPGHGRVEGGHTPAIGWRHSRKDLSCAARDLYGWARPAPDGLSAEAAQRQRNECLNHGPGYSWILVVVAFLAVTHRRWTWLLMLVPVGVVLVYIAYWIGGQLYSARYYFEALTAITVICGGGVAELGRLADHAWAHLRGPRTFAPSWLLYGALGIVTVYSVLIFSPARIEPLRGYGRINQALIEDVQRMRREPDRPVVVIVWGEHHWRDIGALMAVTVPTLDSEIVLARDPDANTLDRLLDQWPDREKIYFVGGQLRYTLPDEPPRAE